MTDPNITQYRAETILSPLFPYPGAAINSFLAKQTVTGQTLLGLRLSGFKGQKLSIPTRDYVFGSDDLKRVFALAENPNFQTDKFVPIALRTILGISTLINTTIECNSGSGYKPIYNIGRQPQEYKLLPSVALFRGFDHLLKQINGKKLITSVNINDVQEALLAKREVIKRVVDEVGLEEAYKLGSTIGLNELYYQVAAFSAEQILKAIRASK